jgi:hypothetical protein
MKTIPFGSRAFSIGLAVALLAGCGAAIVAPYTNTPALSLTNKRTSITPSLYKIATQIGSGWYDPDENAVNSNGDVFVLDKNGLYRVSPPFTGPAHGKMKLLLKVGGKGANPEYFSTDYFGNVFFNNPVNGKAVSGIYRANAKGDISQVCVQSPCSGWGISGLASDATGTIYFDRVISGSQCGQECSAIYEVPHSGGKWGAPEQYGPLLPCCLGGLAIDGSHNIYAIVYTGSGYSWLGEVGGSGNIIPVGPHKLKAESLAVERGCKTSCPVYFSGQGKVAEVSPPFTGPNNGKVTRIFYNADAAWISVSSDNVYMSIPNKDKVVELVP